MSNSSFPYAAFDEFVLRAPILPLQFFVELTSRDEVSDKDLKNAFQDPVIREAVFLASPTLFFELQKWINGDLDSKKAQRVTISLLKYLSRMSSRCTPFGLFAGCATGNFSETTNLPIGAPTQHRRFTRPDMNYLVALSQDFAKKEHIKSQLTYFPNSSLYSIGDQLRYIEYFYVESRRQHHIVEIDHSPYLEKVLQLASEGASLKALAEQLMDETISAEEAYGFLDELLESQVLTSNLEPSVSGPPFVEQMLTVLSSLQACEAEISFLEEIAKRFKVLDEGLGNPTQAYLDLSEFIKKEPTGFELKFLFQTDLELSGQALTLNRELLGQIQKALQLFNSITPPPENNNLKRFKEAFQARYEEREMPLSLVLDVETGIGYIQDMGSGDVNPLVDDLIIPPEENTFNPREVKLNKFHQLLFDKVTAANAKGLQIIHLQKSDVKDFETNWEDVPDTLSTMTELIQMNGQTKISLSGCGGSSAANLLGRFCHEESGITSFAKSIVTKESSMEPDAILAEIVHLPEARAGNILMRPSFREFEIPYLANSVLQTEKKLTLDDLYISIRNNRVFLRSKKYNKAVLPRLSNAHNYSANALPIYHFLADLQTQDLRGGIYFNFGPLDGFFDFLPRVEYSDLILHEAKWRIRKKEFENWVAIRKDKEALQKKIKGIREERRLPQYVLLVDGDNELLINLNNYSSVLMLLETVKNRDEFVLKEFLHQSEGLVHSEKGYHTNQVIMSFYNALKSKQAMTLKAEYDTA
ncbi:MAG: lantibiotic dehydratase family protein [Bacteroidota bacterium]